MWIKIMAARVFVDNFCSVMLCSLLVLLFIVPAPPSLFTDLSFFLVMASIVGLLDRSHVD